MLPKIPHYILRRQKLHHRDPRRHVHRIHVIAIHERTERISDHVQMLLTRPHTHVRLLIEEVFKALDRLRTATQALQDLVEMPLEHGQLRLGGLRYRLAAPCRKDLVPVQVDQPHVVGHLKVRSVLEEAGRHADYEGRGREQELLCLFHDTR